MYHLFVGLGNKGEEYKYTRHNFGFLCVDSVAKEYNFEKEKSKFNSQISFGEINSNGIIIMKPNTYMNNSGMAVKSVSSFYKISLDRIFVFHDDLDLELGRIKFKIGGGSAGHNGLKSIDSCVSNNYARIRLGIGHPAYGDEVVNYVISRFSKEELEVVSLVNQKIVENIYLLLSEKQKDREDFINRIKLG